MIIFIDAEIVDFVDNQLADAIKPVVMRGCIYGTRQVWRLFILMYVPEEFKKMQQAVCNLPSVQPAIANAWNPPGNCAVASYCTICFNEGHIPLLFRGTCVLHMHVCMCD